MIELNDKTELELRMKKAFEQPNNKVHVQEYEKTQTFQLKLSNCEFRIHLDNKIIQNQIIKLNIHGSYITWKILPQITRMFPNLSIIYSNCWKYQNHLTANSQTVANWTLSVPNLRSLSLIDCFLSDSVVADIAKNLPELTTFDITDNYQVTMDVLSIVHTHLPKLKDLRVKGLLKSQKTKLHDIRDMKQLESLYIGYKKIFLDDKSKTLHLHYIYDKYTLFNDFHFHTGFNSLVELDIHTQSSSLISLAKIRSLKKLTITSKPEFFVIGIRKILANCKNLIFLKVQKETYGDMIEFAHVFRRYKKMLCRNKTQVKISNIDVIP